MKYIIFKYKYILIYHLILSSLAIYIVIPYSFIFQNNIEDLQSYHHITNWQTLKYLRISQIKFFE